MRTSRFRQLLPSILILVVPLLGQETYWRIQQHKQTGRIDVIQARMKAEAFLSRQEEAVRHGGGLFKARTDSLATDLIPKSLNVIGDKGYTATFAGSSSSKARCRVTILAGQVKAPIKRNVECSPEAVSRQY